MTMYCSYDDGSGHIGVCSFSTHLLVKASIKCPSQPLLPFPPNRFASIFGEKLQTFLNKNYCRSTKVKHFCLLQDKMGITHILSSCDEPRTLMCSYFLIFMSASVINLAHHATCFSSVHTHALLTYSTPHMLEMELDICGQWSVCGRSVACPVFREICRVG